MTLKLEKHFCTFLSFPIASTTDIFLCLLFHHTIYSQLNLEFLLPLSHSFDTYYSLSSHFNISNRSRDFFLLTENSNEQVKGIQTSGMISQYFFMRLGLSGNVWSIVVENEIVPRALFEKKNYSSNYWKKLFGFSAEIWLHLNQRIPCIYYPSFSSYKTFFLEKIFS